MKYGEYLKTDEWQRTRRWALDRAGNKCQLCKSDKKLNVHHNNYSNLGKEEPSDIIVLCEKCHKKFHAKKVRVKSLNLKIPYYKEIGLLIEQLKNETDDGLVLAFVAD